MLARMFGVTDGVHDRLIEYSRPMSGADCFVPSVQELHAAAG
jgi:deferrochelatase/peroxidase EfeB